MMLSILEAKLASATYTHKSENSNCSNTKGKAASWNGKAVKKISDSANKIGCVVRSCLSNSLNRIIKPSKPLCNKVASNLSTDKLEPNSPSQISSNKSSDISSNVSKRPVVQDPNEIEQNSDIQKLRENKPALENLLFEHQKALAHFPNAKDMTFEGISQYRFTKEACDKIKDELQKSNQLNCPVKVIAIGDCNYLRVGEKTGAGIGAQNIFFYGFDQSGKRCAITKTQLQEKKTPTDSQLEELGEQIELASKLDNAHHIAKVKRFTPRYCVAKLGGANLTSPEIRSYTKEQRLKVYKSIFKGLKEMHSNNLVHTDLKPANIVLSDKKGALIIDYVDTLSEKEKTCPVRGTPLYLAPEAVSAVVNGSRMMKVTPAVDIWAAMRTICDIEYDIAKKRGEKESLVSKQLLFHSTGLFEVLGREGGGAASFIRRVHKNISNKKNLFDNIPLYVKRNPKSPLDKLIIQMAHINPADRPSASAILEQWPPL